MPLSQYAAKTAARPEAIPLLRESMQLRRHTVPHMLALLDSTRLLVKALEGSDGRGDVAKAVLKEELKEAPVGADLRKLQRKLEP